MKKLSKIVGGISAAVPDDILEQRVAARARIVNG